MIIQNYYQRLINVRIIKLERVRLIAPEPGGALGEAKRGGRIDAEYVDFTGEKIEFFEGEAHRVLFGMTIDFGQKLGGGELTADHVALQAGHVDAIGGKAAKGFE